MTKKEFIDIMGEIDKKLIESTLDIETPYEELFLNERPQQVYVPKKDHGALKFSVCAAACLAAVVGAALIIKNVNKTPVTPPFDMSDSSDPISASSGDTSDVSSEVSSGSSSETVFVTSEIIPDPGDPNDLYIDRDNLHDPTILNSTNGLECKTLLYLRSPAAKASISGIYVNESEPCILAKSSDRAYFFDLSKDGSSKGRDLRYSSTLDHLIKNNAYSDNTVFSSTKNYEEFEFYDTETLQMISGLRTCHCADILPDEKKYLYIDRERGNLILYNMATDYNTTARTASSFTLGTAWVLDNVNAVSPELATVRLLKRDPDNASEYTGNEEFRTFLLDLRTLDIIQKLPDDSEVMALDNENFLVAERISKGLTNERRIYRAKLRDGVLVDMGEDPIYCEYSADVLMSPNKKVAVIRETQNGKIHCTAVSTDDLSTIWEIRFSDEGFITGLARPAAVTDDAVLYISDGLDTRLPVYRIGFKDPE